MLPTRPVALYTRKSSVDDGKQVASHEQQIEAILKLHAVPEHFPGTTIPAWWRDSCSGSSFEKRPGLSGFLTTVAEAYPQPASAPGRLFIYDESRFSRALKDGQVDLRSSQEMQNRFARLGWQIVFVNRPPTGNAVMDTIMDTIAFAQSSDYLVKLSASVKRGRLSWGLKGYWLGGPAPFPARRIEATTRRTLPPGVKSTEQTILEVDPERLIHWSAGAEMLLSGRTVMDVVRYFQEHVPTIYKTRSGRETHWSHTTISKVYSNPALIGELHYELGGEVVVVRAKWEPIVDVDVYRRVRMELARRAKRDSKNIGRNKGSRFAAQMVRCAGCGSRYHGTTSNGIRYYIHYAPAEPFLRGDQLRRAIDAGCRSYSVNAERLESVLRDVIVDQRCAPPAADAVANLYRQKREHGVADSNLARLRGDLLRLESQYANVREALRDTTDANLRKDLLADGTSLRRELEETRFKEAAEIARLSAATESIDAIHRILGETARIAKVWDESSVDERQAVIDQWVDHVFIDVEREAGRVRKVASIFLALTPNQQGRRGGTKEEVTALIADVRKARDHRTPIRFSGEASTGTDASFFGDRPPAKSTEFSKSIADKHLAEMAPMCFLGEEGPRCRSSLALGYPRG